jgi:hypothetical protein
MGMTDEVARSLYQGSPEQEERFKYDIIRGLSDSVRQLAIGIADMQKTQVGILERLATLEANKFAVAIDGIKADVKVLMIEKEQRAGAKSAFGMIKEWSPFIGMIMGVLAAAWLYGRSAGIVPAPPVAPTRVEATIHPNDRIDGVVGGKP